ncbi:NAD(P)-dependent oxidoreductase [Candidatus Pacearchaeota archaeon]|nr:NAD(P)-dependent oxidoreductase [Candidatus Pacearchaeota archaeon]
MTELAKTLIIGAQGRIGSMIPWGIKLSRLELDVTKPEQIARICAEKKPSAILCLSSLDLRKSEQNPLEAYKVNVLGVYHAAQEAQKRNIPCIIISSGAVFNGESEQEFTEESTPNPQNIYGQTKYIAELMVRSICPKHLIIRTGWLYGFRENPSFIDKMIQMAREGKEIKATYDQKGSPIYLSDFMQALEELIRTDASGTYHLVNAGGTSAVELMHEVLSLTKSTSLLHEVTMQELNSQGPARSASEVLSSTRYPMRHWRDALRSYLASQR